MLSNHLPSNSRSTTPNTSRGHKLSDSKNPDLPARDAARQHWTSKGTDSDRCIVLSDSDNDDDAAEIGRSVQTQAPMGASQAQVRRPVLLPCNAPATLSAQLSVCRRLRCSGRCSRGCLTRRSSRSSIRPAVTFSSRRMRCSRLATITPRRVRVLAPPLAS